MQYRIFTLALVLAISACSGSDDPPPANQPPTIAPIADQMVDANQSLAPISLTLSDDSTAIGSLLVSVSSDNDVLVPTAAIVISAGTNGPEFVITPSAAMIGETTITVTVADMNGSTANTSFNLEVIPETLSYAQFLRDVFSDDAKAIPRDLNSRQFIHDANDDDFADLL